jgi:hypothetical protein
VETKRKHIKKGSLDLNDMGGEGTLYSGLLPDDEQTLIAEQLAQ